jgi:hypothetical protein
MKTKLAMAAILIGTLAGTAGIAAAQDGRYYDRDDYRYYDNDSYRDGMRVAQQFGWRDGSEVAREDMWRGKPFNPNPRGRYDDADHGYRHEFGSKREYRERYSEAYSEGYERTFRGRSYGRDGDYR